MRKTATEIKAELLAKYASILDDVLNQDEARDELTLTDIEDRALRAQAEVGKQVTTALMETEGGQSIPGPHCPNCGQEMRYKGLKHRYLRTRSGDVEVERAYYYCRRCRRGRFPPG